MSSDNYFKEGTIICLNGCFSLQNSVFKLFFRQLNLHNLFIYKELHQPKHNIVSEIIKYSAKQMMLI